MDIKTLLELEPREVLRRLHLRLVRIGSTHVHWMRVVMNRETLKLVEDLGPEQLDVLEISGGVWGKRKQFRSFQSPRYPELDICETVPNGTFDLIIAEQVFEHLARPLQAGRNVFAALRPGGAFLITTPFLVKIHSYPTDCSRWTPDGLVNLLEECGFDREDIQVDSWGNRACMRANLRGDGKTWVRYKPWLHSLKNEPGFPLQVWALARKKTAGL